MSADALREAWLIEIFVPLGDPPPSLEELRRTLTERFGGVTAFERAPARGFWAADDGRVEEDRIVVLEVMADAYDAAFWGGLKRNLERTLRQEEVLVRVTKTARV
ncbi:MAG: hypothetical protein JWN93_1520 [Hyphomicrobiales bacterium]|nr:hypothetical protein [Hyphomicrobiales bacterium]